MINRNQVMMMQVLNAIRPSISPIFSFDPSQTEIKIRNGTMFFIQNENNIYALTAYHVHNALGIFQDKVVNRNVFILGEGEGQAFADLEPIIVFSEQRIDLIVYQIPPSLLPENIRPFSGRILQDSSGITEGITLVTLGFPGATRIIQNRNIVFGIFSCIPILDSISSQEVLNITLSPDRMEPIGQMAMPNENFNLGGMSGAPIFFINQSGIETWDLCGIITQDITFEDTTTFMGPIINQISLSNWL